MYVFYNYIVNIENNLYIVPPSNTTDGYSSEDTDLSKRNSGVHGSGTVFPTNFRGNVHLFNTAGGHCSNDNRNALFKSRHI